MFTDPYQTAYDFRFRLFGVPIRIHPFFWLAALFLSPPSAEPVPTILCWTAAMLTGILVHEFGHVIVQKFGYGANPYIVLYAFGGLACCDTRGYRRTPGTLGSILISLAGPLAGFMLVVAVVGIALACGLQVGVSTIMLFNVIPLPLPIVNLPIAYLAYLDEYAFYLLYISIFWGVFNLLPIYPLDGGHICREICLLFSIRRGIVISLVISSVTAVAFAILLFADWASRDTKCCLPFNAILMGVLAFISWQSLQNYVRGYR
ncbi:MAG: site-2 protease family protein [Planctomycetaceae bacterium]|jgi:Zn-dependent protease|nr:site-2 protease family protein [Planctomycetaceae bacterium]